MRFGFLARAAAGATAVLSALTAFSSAALAQGNPPQDTMTVFEDPSGGFWFERDAEAQLRSSVDEHGVDLLSGDLIVGDMSVAIGNPGAGGLSYARQYIGGAWRDSVAGGISATLNKYTVTTGVGVDTFTKSGPNFTHDQGLGATLEYDSATDMYTYTSASGFVVEFDEDLARNIMQWPDNAARISKITAPSGEVTTYHYSPPEEWCETLPDTSMNCEDIIRLASITNNRGYQLKFEYEFDYTGASYLNAAQYEDWRTITKVTGVNRSVDYCEPAADICTVSAGLPSLTYTSTSSSYTTTDAEGVAITYNVNGSDDITSIVRGGATTTFVYSGGRVSKVTYSGTGVAAGTDWDYGYVTGSIWTVTRTNPSGTTLIVKSQDNAASTNQNVRLISETTNAAGIKVEYDYDAQDRVETITEVVSGSDHRSTVYEYDGGVGPSHADYERGNVTEVTRKAKPGSGLADIVQTATYPALTDTACTTSRVNCNKPTSTTDPVGAATNYEYESHGGLKKVTYPDPDVDANAATAEARPETRYTYVSKYAYYKNSASGPLVAFADAVYVPKQISQCEAATAANPASCVGTFDETLTDFNYGTTAASPNLLPLKVSTGDGVGALTEQGFFIYTAAGDVSAVNPALSGSTDTVFYFHDAMRRRYGVITPDPDGAGPRLRQATRTVFDTQGRPTNVKVGTATGTTEAALTGMTVLQEQVVEYDALGRPIAQKLLSGSVIEALVQASYDTSGRVVCQAQRMNATLFSSPPSNPCSLGTEGSFGPDRIVKTVYDSNDRPQKVITAFASTEARDEVTTSYNNDGTVAWVEDAEGNRTGYIYDGFARRVQTRFPSKTTAQTYASGCTASHDCEELVYDAYGRLAGRWVRGRNQFVFTYDKLGRLIKEDNPDGSSSSADDAEFEYDLLGRVTRVDRIGASWNWVESTFDEFGRLATEETAKGTVTYGYDTGGRMTTLTYPGGFYVNYDYDLVGGITAVRENGATSGVGVLASYDYDNLGRRTKVTYGNGVETTYAFDGASRLTELDHDFAGTTHDQQVDFDYSPAGQITERAASNSLFRYDAFAAIELITTVNGLNQATSEETVGGSTRNFTYDARGNMTGDGAGNTYFYNARNQLRSRNGGDTAGGQTLFYDPLGRLFSVKEATVATQLIYSGQALLIERDPSSGDLRSYVHGPGMDEPIVWYEGSGTSDRRFLAADERGSIIAISDGNPTLAGGGANPDFGKVTDVNTYDEYGRPDASNVGRFQYTGQIWLAEFGIELYHYKARAYDPKLGRFLQTDPIGYADGMNMYAYVGGDPINMVDPTGLTEDIIVVTGTRRDPNSCYNGDPCFDYILNQLTSGLADTISNLIDNILEDSQHSYETENTVCDRELTTEEQRDLLSRFMVPNQFTLGTPQSAGVNVVTTIEGVGLSTLEGWPVGLVRTSFSPDGLSGRNQTIPGAHVFVGYADRSISTKNGRTVIQTSGYGSAGGGVPGNVRDGLNSMLGAQVFNSIDARARAYAKENYEGC